MSQRLGRAGLGVRVGARGEGEGEGEGAWRGVDVAFDAPAQIEVAVEEVAVAVLFGRPLPRPSPPGRVHGTCGVVGALKRVEQREIRGERLLGDHVADQHE
eukprot:scaffold21636_cov60-Phaeocystis_antarctica.AAC.5